MSFTSFSGNQVVNGTLTVSGAIEGGSIGTTGNAGSSEIFGLLIVTSGMSTGSSAPLITPANVNGTAAQLSDTSRDYMIYLTVGTAGTALTVKIGPTSGVADTIYTAATATAGQTIAFRLPAGWWWEWAATTATLAEQSAVGC